MELKELLVVVVVVFVEDVLEEVDVDEEDEIDEEDDTKRDEDAVLI